MRAPADLLALLRCWLFPPTEVQPFVERKVGQAWARESPKAADLHQPTSNTKRAHSFQERHKSCPLRSFCLSPTHTFCLMRAVRLMIIKLPPSHSDSITHNLLRRINCCRSTVNMLSTPYNCQPQPPCFQLSPFGWLARHKIVVRVICLVRIVLPELCMTSLSLTRLPGLVAHMTTTRAAR